MKAGASTTLAAAVATVVTGDIQGKMMMMYQPMKMAAARVSGVLCRPDGLPSGNRRTGSAS